MNPRILHYKVVMFRMPQLYLRVRYSLWFLCMLCSPQYTAVQIKNCSRSTSVVATMQKYNGATCSSYNLKLKYPLPNSLHSRTNQELFEKYLCNQSSHYEKYGWFLLRKEANMCNHQINTFHCQQRWIKHKGGHWLVPEQCIGRTAVCQKAPSWTKTTSNSEKIKQIVLDVIELRWSEGIR